MQTMKDFRIILIGGGSSSGKSTLAKSLAEKLGINLLHLDDVRIAIQQTHNKEHPINYFLDKKVFVNEDIKTLVEKHNEVSKIVCDGLIAIIEHHELMRDSIIIEGDDILPEFAAKVIQKEYVSAIFIIETAAEKIRLNLTNRGRGIRQLSDSQLNKMIDFIALDNKRISEDAKRLNLPTLESQPNESLIQRALRSLSA